MAQKLKQSIKDWPLDERPREKVLRNGVGTLSKSELLAILIGSGNAEASAVELMKKVLVATALPNLPNCRSMTCAPSRA